MLTSVEKYLISGYSDNTKVISKCVSPPPRAPRPPQKNPFILHRFESGNRSCLGGNKLDIVLIGSE